MVRQSCSAVGCEDVVRRGVIISSDAKFFVAKILNFILLGGFCPDYAMVNWLLIVRDAQGLRGKKVEVHSLPYSSINMWSSENAGSILDFTGELELWTRAGKIKISVGKQVDVRRLDMLITMCVDQPETPATASNAHRNLCWDTVRAGVDKRGCGTCPLNARHVPELF